MKKKLKKIEKIDDPAALLPRRSALQVVGVVELAILAKNLLGHLRLERR